MTCSKTQLLIDEIGDLDRLPPAAARHVAACTVCERFGVELVELRALLREPGRIPAPVDFDANLARRLRAARVTTPRRPFVAWFAVPRHALATAAAIGLVAVTTIGTMNLTSTTPTVQPQMASFVPPATDVSRPGNAVPAVVPEPGVPEELPIAKVSSPTRVRRTVAPRPSVETGPGATTDAMILVRDDAGTRVVSVPTVLVGGERAMPASVALAAPAASDASVSF